LADTNYKQFVTIQARLRSKGFVVLAFPCNEFASQEPGSNRNISAKMKEKYGVNFPMFAKVGLNKPCTETREDMCSPDSVVCCTPSNSVYRYLKSTAVGGTTLWNYEKYVIDRQGNAVKRFLSTSSPETVVSDKDVAKLINTPPSALVDSAPRGFIQ